MNIGIGDMVIVVRPDPCCGYTGDIGLTFRVSQLWESTDGCSLCGDCTPCVCATGDDIDDGYPLETLQRLDPLHESEESEQVAA